MYIITVPNSPNNIVYMYKICYIYVINTCFRTLEAVQKCRRFSFWYAVLVGCMQVISAFFLIACLSLACRRLFNDFLFSAEKLRSERKCAKPREPSFQWTATVRSNHRSMIGPMHMLTVDGLSIADPFRLSMEILAISSLASLCYSLFLQLSSISIFAPQPPISNAVEDGYQ
jgi:hypothetical protein